MVRLNRTGADTFRYYARARATRVSTVLILASCLTGAGVWQYPAAAATVQSWAAAVSGQGQTLTAQSALSDALAAAKETAKAAPSDKSIDASALTSLIGRCETARTGAQPAAMTACTTELTGVTRQVAAAVDRHTNATGVLALEKRAAEAQQQRDTAAQQAAQAAAAAAQAAAEEAARQAQQQAAPPPAPQPDTPSQPSGGQEQPAPAPARPQASSLTTTVTCSSRQAVTATASGGGTVSVAISGAGSASNSGAGGASATATGQGTFTITASATGGGLSLNPSWTGGCS